MADEIADKLNRSDYKSNRSTRVQHRKSLAHKQIDNTFIDERECIYYFNGFWPFALFVAYSLSCSAVPFHAMLNVRSWCWNEHWSQIILQHAKYINHPPEYDSHHFYHGHNYWSLEPFGWFASDKWFDVRLTMALVSKDATNLNVCWEIYRLDMVDWPLLLCIHHNFKCDVNFLMNLFDRMQNNTLFYIERCPACTNGDVRNYEHRFVHGKCHPQIVTINVSAHSI